MKQFADRLQKAKEASSRVNELVTAEAELKERILGESQELQNRIDALQNELERIMDEKES